MYLAGVKDFYYRLLFNVKKTQKETLIIKTIAENYQKLLQKVCKMFERILQVII
jgi:hypothetical protein